MIVCADNLEVMRGMDAGSVDLIATDPPYNSGVNWGAFDDRMGLQAYLEFMSERIVEFHRLLKPTGSLYV